MKINAITIFCIISISLSNKSYPQLIDDFHDFPWESSKKNVKDFMFQMNTVRINSEGNDFIVFENRFVYEETRFGEYPIKYWRFRFFNDSLYDVTIVPDSIQKKDTLAIHNLKNFIDTENRQLADKNLFKFDYTWLLYDSSGKLLGVIQVDSNPSSSFGNRIRVYFRHIPILMHILEQDRFIY